MKRISRLYIIVACCLCSTVVVGQGIGDGSDGSPNITGIVNDYAYLVKDAPRCAYQLEVNDGSAFDEDDLVLVIQMQGAGIIETNTVTYGTVSDLMNAGNYEYAYVDNVEGNVLSLKYSLLRAYQVIGNVQVIRVPQYADPTITGTIYCPKWNGSTGGVVAIDATGTITFNANIDVSRRGFRGAEVINGPDYISDTTYIDETPSLVGNAIKGEGIALNGIDPFTSGRGAAANGGGGGNSHTAGGGGGSNFGCGGDGGWGYPSDGFYKKAKGGGGHVLSYSNISNKIFMGGGGGAGSSHADEGTEGGYGGGIVILTVNSIQGNANSILAIGESSQGSNNIIHADGIGGGGAGGTVLLSINNLIDTMHVNVKGGDGGDSPMLGAGPGGGGGGGLCWLSLPTVPSKLSLNISGGIPGTADGNDYGAVVGCDGGPMNDLAIPYNDYAPPVIASFDIQQNTPVLYSFLNNSSGADSYQWNFGDGQLDYSESPTYSFSIPGIYQIILVAYDAANCSDTAVDLVSLPAGNVFSPNNDGVNDLFIFNNTQPEFYEVNFEILNRWGNVVFRGESSNAGWDGTYEGNPAPSGTYYYVIRIVALETEELITYKGYLTLLR